MDPLNTDETCASGFRVLRGGSVESLPSDLRVTARASRIAITSSYEFQGFRCRLREAGSP